MRAVAAKALVPVHVMIRPRSGDFVYSADEVEVMLRDIEAAKTVGVQGLVGGALNPNGTIDEDVTEALVEAASPLPFTFHRAFDLTLDLDESLDACLALGVRRILTSGGAALAKDGADALVRLRQRASTHATILVGGGVRATHVKQLVTKTGVREVHLGPRVTTESPMEFRDSMTGASFASSTLSHIDADAIAATVAQLTNL